MACDRYKHVVVVGGGIAGVTCAETLSSLAAGALRITVVSASPAVKVAVNVVQLTRAVERFDVGEAASTDLQIPGVNFINDVAVSISVEGTRGRKKGWLGLKGGRRLDFDACCLATGASPSVPKVLLKHLGRKVLTIRDTDSVELFKKRLKGAKSVVVLGNGGIALELVHELSGCDILWVVRDGHIGNAFFDKPTAEALSRMSTKKTFLHHMPASPIASLPAKRTRATEERQAVQNVVSAMGPSPGSGVGPNWIGAKHKPFMIVAKKSETCEAAKRRQDPKNDGPSPLHGDKGDRCILKILYNCGIETVEEIGDSDAPDSYLKATFSDGTCAAVDLIIAATGVKPNVEWIKSSPAPINVDDGSFQKAGCEAPYGVLVQPHTLVTSCEGIYAAGDCCTVFEADETTISHESNWFQMRLWTQARITGRVVARSIATFLLGDAVASEGLEFDLFAHTTKFLGRKVVLLGKYNAQGLEDGFEIIERGGADGDETFVRVVLQNGRLRGAILIGNTCLEETFENLILGGLQVGHLGSELVDPSVDLEDYFD